MKSRLFVSPLRRYCKSKDLINEHPCTCAFLVCRSFSPREEPKVRDCLVAIFLRRAANLEANESPLCRAPVKDTPYARPRTPLDAAGKRYSDHFIHDSRTYDSPPPTGPRAAELTRPGHPAHIQICAIETRIPRPTLFPRRPAGARTPQLRGKLSLLTLVVMILILILARRVERTPGRLLVRNERRGPRPL